MGPLLTYLISAYTLLKNRGGIRRVMRHYVKMFRNNHVSSIMAIVIVLMAVIIANLNVKLNQAYGSHIPPPILATTFDNGPRNMEPTHQMQEIGSITEDTPPSEPLSERREKMIAPSIRRYAAERLEELSRSTSGE